MGIVDKVTNPVVDIIWSYHICGCIYCLLTALAITLVLIFLVPIWQFGPIPSNCLVTGTSVAYEFTGNDYVTFKEYRGIILVNYSVSGNVVPSAVYGPSNQGDSNLRNRGLGLSLYYATQFAQYYRIGNYYKCYYSRKDFTNVSFSISSNYSWLVIVPIPFFIIAICLCCFPFCYGFFDKRRKDKEALAEFMKFDAQRTERQELERMLKREGGGFDDTGAKEGFGDIDAYGYGDPDEEPYEVASIENVGNFFEGKVEEVQKEEVLVDMGDEGSLRMSWN